MDETFECTFCRRPAQTYHVYKEYPVNPNADCFSLQTNGYGVTLLRSKCCLAVVVSRGTPQALLRADITASVHAVREQRVRL